MTIQFHSTLKRLTMLVIAGALGIGLFATGVWAGAAGNPGDRAQTIQPVSSGWRYDARTGSPTGPQGQPDFWNYDPTTGEKIADASPRVAPDDLAALSGAEQMRTGRQRPAIGG